MILVEPFEIIAEDCLDYINNKHFEDAYEVNAEEFYETIYKESFAPSKHNCTKSCNYIQENGEEYHV